jgi:hypothetical protein
MLLHSKPLSLCLSYTKDGPWGEGGGGGGGAEGDGPLVCFVGLENEMLIRVHVNAATGTRGPTFVLVKHRL